jgi:hypothetical protein
MKLSSAAIAAATVLFAVSAMGLTVTTISQVTRPSSSTYGAEQISGITYAGGNLFYAVDDNDNKLYPLTLAINRSNGTLASGTSGITIGTGVLMSGGNDVEGCAFDPCSGKVWVSQETSALIKEYDPSTGELLRSAPVPAIQKQYVGNYSLEALTISGDGKTMWTCNEEALKVDGALATNSVGSVVRLTRFTRDNVRDNWTPNGEWAYETQPIGTLKDQYTRSGVSGLCALPDGTLLTLERRCYDGGLFPDFEIRIYQVNFSGATDVSSFAALKGATYTKTTKSLLWSYKHGSDMPNYEGICLGPRLDDGSSTLVLVGDGGSSAEKGIFVLKLTGLDIRTVNFAAPSAGESSIVGNNYRFLNGAAVDVNLAGVEYGSAYTNNNAVCSNVQWTATGATPASGTGANASFTVGASDVNFSWTVTDMGHVSTTVDSADTFEEYSVDTLTEGSAIPGWSGDGCVVATNYPPPSIGYAMPKDPHTKVLEVDGSVVRMFANTTNSNDKLDMMVSIAPMGADAPMPDDVSDSQVALVCGADGKLLLFCRTSDAPDSTNWVSICDRTFTRGQWIRFEISMDYTTNPSDAYAYIRIDGEYCPTQYGVRSPSDPAQNGPWYRVANVPSAQSQKRINSLTVTNSGYVDDVLKTTSEFVTEREVADANTVTIDKVPVSFLEAYGDTALLDPNAPVDGSRYPNLAAAGYSVGDMYTAGVDPDDDEPLKVTDFSLDDNKVEVVLNGTRPDTTGKYVVLRSTELHGGETTELPGSYSVQNVNGTNVTVWTSTYEIGSDPKAFYRVKAVR